jgi:hypothetical protein
MSLRLRWTLLSALGLALGLLAAAGFVGFVLVAGLIAGGVTSTQAARLTDRAAAV